MKLSNMGKQIFSRIGADVTSAFFISKKKKIFNAAISAMTIFTLVAGIYYGVHNAQSADFTFLQANWGGGQSSDAATHTSNKSGWDKYSIKDAAVAPTLDGESIELVNQNSTSDIDFNDSTNYSQQNSTSGTSMQNGNVSLKSAGGASWTQEAIYPASSNQWKSVAYGNSTFVAVAANAKSVATSSDGAVWTPRNLPAGSGATGVVYGNGVFVAIQSGTGAFTSPDGITWTSRVLPTNAGWIDVVYDNNVFVAIASSSSVAATSPDGITWTQRAMPGASAGWNDVTYGNGMFVAIAYSTSTAATSPDGITWTSRTLPSSANSWMSVTFGNGMFVVIPAIGNIIATSPDGTTWTSRTIPVSGTWRSVVYGSGTFIMMSYNSTAAKSSDGITWTSHAIPNSNSYAFGTYCGGHFFAVTANDVTMSADGITWSQRYLLPTTALWKSVAYGNGIFVAVSSGSDSVSTSADGIAWTSRSLPSYNQWKAIAYGNGTFVILTEGSALAATSPDGITWTQRTLPVSKNWSAITYSNGLFVAVAANGSSVAITSPNGITWTQRSLPASRSWASVTYGNDKFVAIADSSNKAATSPDGITWTERTMPLNIAWKSVTYGNGVYVAVARLSDKIATSPDGIIWTERTIPLTSWWYSITYGNGTFVAVASYGSSIAITSPDGITWTQRSLPSAGDWVDITYGNGRFVAVAEGAAFVATSGSASYPTIPYYITTANGSQIDTSAWPGITGVVTTETTPANTHIKYLVSFDNRVTWKYWNGSNWQSANLSNIETYGMDKSSIEAISQINWSAAGGFISGTPGSHLDIAASLLTSDISSAPILDNIAINHAQGYLPSQTLTSSIYNTELPASNISKIQWVENIPTNTDIRFQLRTSSDGITWGSWCGPDNSVDGTCNSATYFTDPAGNESIDDIQRDRTGDQFIQYKAFLISTDGVNTPTLQDISLSYATVSTSTVSTGVATNTTAASATLNGNIVSTGGNDPERQIEWGTQTNVYTNQCTAGLGTVGAYSCNLTALAPGTTYYFRAKAINSEGVSYGTESQFTTLPPIVTISEPDTTKMANSVSSNYMSVISGSITSTSQVTTNTNVIIQDGIVKMDIPSNTQITKTDSGNFNFQNFVAESATNIVKQTMNNSISAVKVGVTGTKISFSQPITISIDVDSGYNGRTLDVLYQNDGETTWHSQTSCTITSGKCIFTTNHATTYSVNGSGNMAGETGINLNTDIQEVIALDCGATAINLGNITPGTPITGSSTCTATTNANGGYNLSVRRDDATSTLKKNTENSVTISDLTPWDPTTPNSNTWSGNGLGFTVFHSTANKNASWWGTGTTLTDSNNKYAGFNTTQSDIMRNSTYAATSTATDIGYMLNVPPTQKSGAYSGSVTYQAVTTP